jgi:hypothetical protein
MNVARYIFLFTVLSKEAKQALLNESAEEKSSTL